MNTDVNIVFLDRDGLPPHIQVPHPSHSHHWTEYPATHPDQTLERARDADILIVNKVVLDAHILQQCTRLKHIAVTATGFNVIDIDACQRLGISVSNVPSYAATTVAEHVLACTLMLRRSLLQYRARVIDGAWQTSPAFCLFDQPFQNLSGATMGLIGLGEIGRAVADRAAALGLHVLFCSRSEHQHPYAQQTTLQHLLTQSDIVSVHCSLNSSTQYMIGETELNSMKRHAILINTARGGIVNEDALVAAIESGEIGGMASDVLAQEPPSEQSPLLKIADRNNVIITPHIAWSSDQAMQELTNIVSNNIDAFISGAPQNLVTV